MGLNYDRQVLLAAILTVPTVLLFFDPNAVEGRISFHLEDRPGRHMPHTMTEEI